MFTLNEARKFAGLPQQISEAKVDVMFNNHEGEKANLEKAGIKLSNPRKGGGGNTEVTLTGDEKAIRKYLAKLWDLDTDSEEIDELFEGKSQKNFDVIVEAVGKLNMSKATVVKLASGDGGIELQGEVFGIKNDNEIVAFMLTAMGVPMDGLAIKIRSGFMQYDERSKMLFIARFKSDLPNKRSEK